MKFEALVKRISPKLKGIAYRLNGRFTFMGHDDLYQQALLHLWQAFCAGRLADKTDSYILQGCYFNLRNYIRTVDDKARLISLDGMRDEEGMSLEERLPACDPRRDTGCLESRLTLDALKSSLSAQEREVLSLSLAGLTVREIGSRMGISHVRVVKLRKGLKKNLSKGAREA